MAAYVAVSAWPRYSAALSSTASLIVQAVYEHDATLC